MPVSVISIDVQDDGFKKYVAEFQKYQAQVKALPAAWGKVDAATDRAAAAQVDIVAATLAQNKLLHDQAQMRQQANREEDKAEREKAKKAKDERKAKETADRTQNKAVSERQKAHEKIKKDVIDTSKAVASMTFDLLKWGIGGGALGLIAGGFGLGALTNNVAGAYRTAQGFGVRTGDMQALGANFGRYFDPNAVLGGISQAQSDYSKQWAFNAVGINPAGKDPAQLAVELAMNAKRIYDASGGKVNDPRMQAAAILGLSLEDMRRLARASVADLNASRSQYGRDSASLAISDRAQLGWTKFQAALNTASASIQNILGEGLADLTPVLGDLVKAVTSDFATFVKNGEMKKWIDEVAQGIETFAAYIGTDKFRQDVSNFVTDFGLIVDKISAGLMALGIIPASSTGGAANGPTPNMGPSVMGRNESIGDMQLVANAAARHGIAPRILNNIYGIESNYGHNTGRSHAGAMGPFQFMPATARRFGLTNINDLGQTSNAAANYMAILMNMFHDVRKAVAAYNWGEGNVARDVRKYGADWERHAPAETRAYVNRVVGVNVTVTSQAGSGLATQTSQLPR